VPPAPGLDDASLLLHPVVIGVLPVAAGTDAHTAAEAARVLLAAGADVVEVVPTGRAVGAAPAGLSPAELIASLTEAGIPAAVSVAGVADVHLAVGSGAALLRRAAPVAARPKGWGPTPSDGDANAFNAALLAGGRPVIQPADDAVIALVLSGGLPPFATALPARIPPAPPPTRTLLELPLAAIAVPRPDRTPRQAPQPGTVLPVVADIDAEHAADRSVVVAQVTAALVVGVRVFRTPDPRSVRRAAHVITAVEAAG
jgi:hypothetical protein